MGKEQINVPRLQCSCNVTRWNPNLGLLFWPSQFPGLKLHFNLFLSQVKGPGIGLLGISKGGELGLAMASFLKGIKAAVIINGSVAAVGNTIYYKDETIPPVSLLRNRVKMTKDGLLDVVEGLQSPLVEEKSFIPVERSDTAFLLLVGQDDHNWKSEFYAKDRKSVV